MKKALDRIEKLLVTIDGQLRDIGNMSTDEIRYNSLVMVTDGFPISQNMATKIVGGKQRLNRLIEQGYIRYLVEPSINDTANKKHRINFADCVKHTKPRLLKIRKSL